MSKESMKMNRRDFLGLGAVAAVGAMGLAGCAPQTSAEKDLSATGDAAATPEAAAVAEDWLGAEPEIAESDIVETLDTDFLIIGAGTAGLAAAGAAADLGLNFIACDKSNQVPETREYLGGVDTAYAKANNVTIDRPKLLNELTRYASGKCNQKLIKRWIDDSAEYIDWVTEVMKDAGKEVMLDMPPEHATGGTDYYVPYVQHLWEPSYVPPTRNDVIAERLSGQGHDILFEHKMVKLVHADGKVTGAIFETKDGMKQINAKNTLLATRRLRGQPRDDDRPAALRCSLLHRLQLQPALAQATASRRGCGPEPLKTRTPPPWSSTAAPWLLAWTPATTGRRRRRHVPWQHLPGEHRQPALHEGEPPRPALRQRVHPLRLHLLRRRPTSPAACGARSSTAT